jgi:hypothetical protein
LPDNYKMPQAVWRNEVMSETLSNLPKLSDLMPLSLVEQLIDQALAPLVTRANELIGACQRFLDANPEITSDEIDAKATEILVVLNNYTSISKARPGQVERARLPLLAPLNAAVDAIGGINPSVNKPGPFAKLIGSVQTAGLQIEKRSTAYKVKIDAERKAAAAAEAERKRQEAEMAERLAISGSGLVTFEDAARAGEEADRLQKIADARPADRTRVHDETGGSSSLKWIRTFTITAPHLVDRKYCVPSDQLIRAAIGNAGKPMPTIAGVEIKDEPDLTVRR